MPRKERSVESRIKEHRKFRAQCQRRIKPSIVLALTIFAAMTLWGVFFRLNLWIALCLAVFVAFSLGMEVYGYFLHTRKLRELGVHDEEDPA
jgi:hypothetical protein